MNSMKSFLLVVFFVIPYISDVSAADYKIGAVNTIRVLEQSPQAITADTLIKEEFSSRDRQLLETQKKIKSMEEHLAKDSAIMKESERKKLEREAINLRRELKRDRDEFREDVNFRFNEVRAEIQKEVFDAIVRVAKEQEYDVIFYDGVAYAGPKVDISELIIKNLKENKQQGKKEEE